MELVKFGMDTTELVQRIKEHGIDFEPDGDYLAALRKAGAQEPVIGPSEGLSTHLRVTIVAPQPPASGGASPKESTNGVRSSTARTICLCTPIPRP